MTTITTIAANDWGITIGGGWIVLMLVGMGICFVLMFGFMWLMRDGRGWAMCGRWWQQVTPTTDFRSDTLRQGHDPMSPESDARP